jgi:integrase
VIIFNTLPGVLTMRQPFFRKQTASWYVKDDAGRFVNLGQKKKKAFTAWKEMLTRSEIAPNRMTLLALCEDFLEEHEKLLSKLKHDDARRICQSLIDFAGANTLVQKMTQGKLVEWLDAQKPGKLRKDKSRKEIFWGDTRKHHAARCITRVFRWGVTTDRLRKNPLAGFQAPTASHREGVITPEVHRQLVQAAMASVQSRSFAVYLIASHCGARPQQIREITAGHCSADFVTAKFDQHKTRKKTGKPLTVYFSPCLQTLLKILASARPEGRLFLNDEGRPWTKDSASRRFLRLRRSLKLPDSIVLYLYRHTFATDALRAGCSEAVTAALLGHTSSEMVRRIYSHLGQHDSELLDAARVAAAKRMSVK